MDQNEIVNRFNNIYLGDSILERIVIDTALRQCQLIFNCCKVLRTEGQSIFDPAERFEPAVLRFDHVKAFDCGAFQLNSTVVDFGAKSTKESDYVEFHFDLTGGSDPSSFMAKLTIFASDFDFGAIGQ